jgi:hypothetical protein
MFVSEIIDDVIEVLGRCDQTRALKKISDAVSALQDEGDWNANIGAVDIRTFADGTRVTLPRDVETPLAVTLDGIPVFMRDEFARFHLNGDGLADDRTVHWVWDDLRTVPTFMDFGTPGPVLVYCDLANDAGILLRILGKDPNGRILREQQLDGSWIDGVTFPAQFISGVPSAPPANRFQHRSFVITPMSQLVSSAAHQLTTGAYMQLSLLAGTFPTPLLNGSYYYVRAIDATHVSLYAARLDATTGQNEIDITSTGATTSLLLTDTRAVSSRTQFQTNPSANPTNLADFDLVTFGGTTLPSPLNSGQTYVSRVNGANALSIYNSVTDATALTNVVNVSTPGTAVTMQALKVCTPVTTFAFTVPHNFLTNDQVTVTNSGGSLPAPLLSGTTYYVHVLDANTVTLHSSTTESATGVNPIVMTNVGSGVNALVKVIPATVTLGPTGNIVTSVAHNLSLPSGSGGVAGTVTLVAQSITGIAVSNGGTGYTASPIVTISAPGGSGTQAYASATVSGGVITGFQIIAGGTGYTSTPTVTITPAGGSLVSFTSDGTFPAPITQGTVYRAEAPMTATTFTLNSTVPAPVALTSLGSGQLFVTISRAFTLGFLPQWQTDATNFITGQSINFFTQGMLPTTSSSPTPIQINPSTLYYFRKISNTIVEVYDTNANAISLSTTAGRISTVALGQGAMYFSTLESVVPIVRDNFLDIESYGYIADFTKVQFTTTGTLPSPLATSTDYLVSIVNGALAIYDTSSAVITLTGIGTGQHNLVVNRTLSVVPSQSLDIPDQQFNLGDALTVLSDNTLPSPLVPATTYYARPLDFNSVVLYDTLGHATNISSTAGVVTFLSTGTGNHVTTQILPPYQIAEVTQMEKPVTDGYVRVYGWDTSQITNLVLLGDLHPTETNPAYRRIKIAEKTQWVRMKYRKRSIAITSVRDFINLDSKMAIMMMVQSQDLLIKRFADEAERYRVISVEYLNKRNRALDGPRTCNIQIDAEVMNRPDDFME